MSTADQWISSSDPRIGGRKVTEVQRSDIAELHHGLRKTPLPGEPHTRCAVQMFNLAEMWGLRPDVQSLPARQAVQGGET